MTSWLTFLILAAFPALSVTSSANATGRPSTLSFIVNGVNVTEDRYNYFVSLTSNSGTYSPSPPSLGTSGTSQGSLGASSPPLGTLGALGGLSNGLSYNNTTPNTSFSPFCGGTLISDRLVLTAAHCAMSSRFRYYYRDAVPSDFRQLGFNFTSFPNTYIIPNRTLQITAVVGARSQSARTAGGVRVSVQAWFVHPFYDPYNAYYDVAVALLATPVNIAPVKLYNPPGDIYTYLPPSTNITAIGLGDVQTDEFAEIEESLNSTFYDQSLNTSRGLAETIIGNLVDRTVCGKVITARDHRNTTSGSSNYQYGTLATVLSTGQMCVGIANNEQTNAAMLEQAQSIVNAAQYLSPSARLYLQLSRVNTTNVSQIYDLIPGYNDTCEGDSGGPILIKGATSAEDVQIGTVSYGEGCGSGVAAVYNIVQAFLNSTTFDSFLMNVMMAVPNKGGQTLSNLVSALPEVQSAG